MEFHELVQTKNTVGAAGDITDEQIQRIIEAGWWSGTSFDLQPWKCIVLRENHTHFWNNFIRIASILMKSNPFLSTVGVQPETFSRYRDSASVTIVLCADESRFVPWFSGQAFVKDAAKMTFFKDMGAVFQNMKLAALNEGLGYDQLNTDLSFRGLDEALQGYLELPGGFRIMGILTLGQPEARAVEHDMPLQTFIYRERWKQKMREECPRASTCGRFELEHATTCAMCRAIITESYFYDDTLHIVLCQKHFTEWLQKGRSESDLKKARYKKPIKQFCSYWIDCDDFILYQLLHCARCEKEMRSYYFQADTREKVCLDCVGEIFGSQMSAQK